MAASHGTSTGLLCTTMGVVFRPPAAAVAAARVFGIESMPRTSSTDANLPISLGIPAITIGRGGLGGRSHSLDEWVDVDPDPTVRGLRVVLTTILAVAGLAN